MIANKNSAEKLPSLDGAFFEIFLFIYIYLF